PRSSTTPLRCRRRSGPPSPCPDRRRPRRRRRCPSPCSARRPPGRPARRRRRRWRRRPGRPEQRRSPPPAPPATGRRHCDVRGPNSPRRHLPYPAPPTGTRRSHVRLAEHELSSGQLLLERGRETRGDAHRAEPRLELGRGGGDGLGRLPADVVEEPVDDLSRPPL